MKVADTQDHMYGTPVLHHYKLVNLSPQEIKIQLTETNTHFQQLSKTKEDKHSV